MYYLNRDGQEGYLNNPNFFALIINLKLITLKLSDKEITLVSIINHSYFNLLRYSFGSRLEHQVRINSDEFTVNDKSSILTGGIPRIL